MAEGHPSALHATPCENSPPLAGRRALSRGCVVSRLERTTTFVHPPPLAGRRAPGLFPRDAIRALATILAPTRPLALTRHSELTRPSALIRPPAPAQPLAPARLPAPTRHPAPTLILAPARLPALTRRSASTRRLHPDHHIGLCDSLSHLGVVICAVLHWFVYSSKGMFTTECSVQS